MRMKMRRKKRKYKGRRAMLGIAAVAMLLLGILFVQGIRLQARAAQYTRRAEELERQIDEEEMRTEEIEEIQPAIDQALAEGICIPEKKPTPPDTVFSKALGGWYDIVVVMYHDQGHIPLKVKGFVYNREAGHWEAVAGVNVTLGLPIIRASVDHGTGFGHAGSGTANALSLVNAIDYAIRLAENRGGTGR